MTTDHKLVRRLKHYLAADKTRLREMTVDFNFLSTMSIYTWFKKNKIPRMHLEKVEKYLNKKGA